VDHNTASEPTTRRLDGCETGDIELVDLDVASGLGTGIDRGGDGDNDGAKT
jgi:hypothetical protein